MPYQASKATTTKGIDLPQKSETEERGTVEPTVQGCADLLLSLTKNVSSSSTSSSSRLVVTPPEIDGNNTSSTESTNTENHNGTCVNITGDSNGVGDMGPSSSSSSSMSASGGMYQQPRMLYHSPIKICSSSLTSSTSKENLYNAHDTDSTKSRSLNDAKIAVPNLLAPWSPSVCNGMILHHHHPMYRPSPPFLYPRRQTSASVSKDTTNENGKRLIVDDTSSEVIKEVDGSESTSSKNEQQQLISPSSSNDKPDTESQSATNAAIPLPPTSSTIDNQRPWMYPYGPPPPTAAMYHQQHHANHPPPPTMWNPPPVGFPSQQHPMIAQGPSGYPPYLHYPPMYAPYHHHHIHPPPHAWGMYGQPPPPPPQQTKQQGSPTMKSSSPSSSKKNTTKFIEKASQLLLQKQKNGTKTNQTKSKKESIHSEHCHINESETITSIAVNETQSPGEDSDEKDSAKSMGVGGENMNRCIPLNHPIPKRIWPAGSDDRKIPDFSLLVNFPDHISRVRTAGSIAANDGMRHCVMCGQLRLCSTNSSSEGSSGGRRPRSMNAADDATTTTSSERTAHIIPRQNKGVCTICDVTVWVVVNHKNLEIKWCKGCKNFRPWAAFGEKGLATKCVRCRIRQKEKYATQKVTARSNTRLYVKHQTKHPTKPEYNDVDDDELDESNILAANGLRKLMKSSQLL